MTRMTMKYLEAKINWINEITGQEKSPYTRTADKFEANIGNYHLDSAYGGWELHQMQTSGGGVTVPLSHGHVSKRELAEKLDSFIRGVEMGKECAK